MEIYHNPTIVFLTTIVFWEMSGPFQLRFTFKDILYNINLYSKIIYIYIYIYSKHKSTSNINVDKEPIGVISNINQYQILMLMKTGYPIKVVEVS